MDNEIKPDSPKPSVKMSNVVAAGATGASSLIFYMFAQIQDMQQVISNVESTQHALISEEGTIRPSTSAIKSEIMLEEVRLRIERLERNYRLNADD